MEYIIVSTNGDFKTNEFSFSDMTSNFKSTYAEIVMRINDISNPKNNLIIFADEEGLINDSEPNHTGTLLYAILVKTALFIRDNCSEEPLDKGYEIYKEKVGMKQILLEIVTELDKKNYILMGAVCITGVDSEASEEQGLCEDTIAFIKNVYNDITEITKNIK